MCSALILHQTRQTQLPRDQHNPTSLKRRRLPAFLPWCWLTVFFQKISLSVTALTLLALGANITATGGVPNLQKGQSDGLPTFDEWSCGVVSGGGGRDALRSVASGFNNVFGEARLTMTTANVVSVAAMTSPLASAAQMVSLHGELCIKLHSKYGPSW